MKKLSLLIIFVLIACNIRSQVSFIEAIGGPDIDQAIYAKTTSDGGYIAVGWTKSFGAGNWDIYLVKTNSGGAIEWTKTYGGPGDEVDCSVEQTTDGGYIITARTSSYGAGNDDVYLIKTFSNGNAQWTKTIGGANDEEGHSIKQTHDGKYIHCGLTKSFGAGNDDIYLIKNDTNGATLFAKTFGGNGIDHGHFIQQTSDRGFIIVGTTTSFGAGGYDIYLVKTDSTGTLQWSKTYGGTGDEDGWDVQVTTDGGYILAGYTTSFGAGDNDVFLLKTDANGLQQWARTYGNTTEDLGYAVEQTTDGGYIVAGETAVVGSDSSDVYLIKTDGNGLLQWSKTYGGQGDDGCQAIEQTTDGGYFISGYTNSFGAGNWDFYLIKTDPAGNVSGCSSSVPTVITNTFNPQINNPTSIVTNGGSISSPTVSVFSGGVANFCATTGIHENVSASNSVGFYPNPFNDLGTIEVNEKDITTSTTFILYDLLGKEAINYTITTSRSEIKRGNLKEGIYFYKVQNGTATLGSGKLIISGQ